MKFQFEFNLTEVQTITAALKARGSALMSDMSTPQHHVEAEIALNLIKKIATQPAMDEGEEADAPEGEEIKKPRTKTKKIKKEVEVADKKQEPSDGADKEAEPERSDG